MKLSALKSLVYTQAQVTTTAALKLNYPSLKSLDFRRKSAWLSALKTLQSQTLPSYAQWLANPPAEYADLFAAMDQTAQTFAQHYATAELMHAELVALVEEMAGLETELEQTEAELIAQEHQRLKRQRQAERN